MTSEASCDETPDNPALLHHEEIYGEDFGRGNGAGPLNWRSRFPALRKSFRNPRRRDQRGRVKLSSILSMIGSNKALSSSS